MNNLRLIPLETVSLSSFCNANSRVYSVSVGNCALRRIYAGAQPAWFKNFKRSIYLTSLGRKEREGMIDNR